MRRRRVVLPGWWKLTGSGIEWSETARERIGMPDPGIGPRDDWGLWASELQDQVGDLDQVATYLPAQRGKDGEQR